MYCHILSPSQVISESTVLLVAPLFFSDRWCWYKLIGCWNKWLALLSKTRLRRLESSWDGLVYSAATFPEQKQGGDSAAELLPLESHATVASFPDVAYASFNVPVLGQLATMLKCYSASYREKARTDRKWRWFKRHYFIYNHSRNISFFNQQYR